MTDSSIQMRYGAEVKTAPTVSIIIPAYNTASLITEALDSVFGQTYKDFEAIVINDGSPDTEALERVLQPYLEQMVYIKQNNRGAAGARNTGIRQARGEYLAFLDSDEMWRPEFLASQMKLFDETPSLDMAYTDALFPTDSGRPAAETWMRSCPSKGPCTFESLVKEDCHIPVSSVVVRKQTIVEAGLFDETLGCIDDYDMWLRVAYHGGKIAYQVVPLVYSRPERPGSLSQNTINTGKVLVKIFMKLGQAPMAPSTRAAVQERLAQEQALLHLTQAKFNLAAGDFAEAGEFLRKANSHLRSFKLRLVLAGLQVAPRFTRLGAEAWRGLLMTSHRLRASMIRPR